VTPDDRLLLDTFRQTRSYAAAGRAVGLARWDARRRVLALQLAEAERPAVTVGSTPTVGQEGAATVEIPLPEGARLQVCDHEVTATGQGPVHSHEEILKRANLDPAEWYIPGGVVNWWGPDKDGDRGNWQLKARYERIPEFLRCGVEPVEVRRERRPEPLVVRERVTLACGDAHFGFEWDDRWRSLTPYHDERALDLVLQIVEAVEPDRIVLLGDMLDLAELSLKYPRRPNQLYTIQPALEALHAWLVRLRRAAPPAQIVYLEGNHEDRLRRYMTAKAGELMPLRRVGTDVGLALPHLLALDLLDIEWAEELADEDERTAYRHGEAVKKGGGATAAHVLRETSFAHVNGHVHRRECGARTVHLPGGRRQEIFVANPGCLCHADGRVPGVDGTPDWQQGCLLITEYGGPAPAVELVPIVEGYAYLRGEALLARQEEKAA